MPRRFTMHRDEFEKLAEEAWEAIPEDVRQHFSNVTIFIQDEPTADDLEAGDVGPGHTLLGLYTGVPISKRGFGYGMVLPDRVLLFQGPIERAARRKSDIPQIVYDTLWHELAHHLGMDEKEVRDAERRRGVED
jgi:predicted Zn-dependent protease with MMP-like domain